MRRSRQLPQGTGRRRGKKLIDALLWNLEWGDRLEFLQDIERNTGKRPAALDRRVLPEPGNILFWKAFQVLSKARRPSLGGLSDIVLSDILAYADLIGLKDFDLRSQLCRIIIDMDAAVIEWAAARKPKPPQKPKV
ncbi:phage tail assembly chaperone [Rhizobium ruizarguesonis]|uniref:phage tail assembly chaperone n=1 Tax=Rhizobium ruizarguesonis TaxID=2081791 RepID=UPI00103096EA|nr:hypothetical protein [Rhizobium ruizarguesonis]TBE67415.1 hypothetical protein ELH00_16230 [Rhizobium ruizarguesonis]